LLRDTSIRAEALSRAGLNLTHARHPIGEIQLAHRPQDPRIHGKGFQAMEAEEENAVGDLLPDAFERE
jgi:hypothetical protein